MHVNNEHKNTQRSMKQSEAIDKLIIANSQAGQNDTKAYNLLLSMLSMYMNPNMANIFSSIFPVQ